MLTIQLQARQNGVNQKLETDAKTQRLMRKKFTSMKSVYLQNIATEYKSE